MLAGVVWIVSGFLAVAYQGEHAPGTFADYLVESTFAAGVLFSAVGLVGLHALQKESYGRIGRAGFYTFLITAAGSILGTVVNLLGSEALGFLVFPVGVLGALVGLVLYGAATLQAKVLPRWCGVGLIVGLPIAIAFGLYGGNVLFGIFWLALGYTLSQRSRAAPQQPARVS